MTNLADVATFISGASPDDLERVGGFIKSRHKALRELRAAAVSVGAKVRLTNLSPKYLNDLTGEVTSIKGQRCTVELDEGSTIHLRYGRGGSARFNPGDAKNAVIPGVPMSSCLVES